MMKKGLLYRAFTISAVILMIFLMVFAAGCKDKKKRYAPIVPPTPDQVTCLVDGICDKDANETIDSCPQDCYCGNDMCDWYETSESCPEDCVVDINDTEKQTCAELGGKPCSYCCKNSISGASDYPNNCCKEGSCVERAQDDTSFANIGSVTVEKFFPAGNFGVWYGEKDDFGARSYTDASKIDTGLYKFNIEGGEYRFSAAESGCDISVTNTEAKTIELTGTLELELFEDEKGCKDTDSGLNYYYYGKVYVDGKLVSDDECNTHGQLGPIENVMAEQYCDGDKSNLEWFVCPHGCEDGACIMDMTSLADYPYMFFDDDLEFMSYVAVGDDAPAADVVAAVEILTGMKQAGIGVGPAVFASEVEEPEYEPLILIGEPCSNELFEYFVDFPGGDCSAYDMIDNTAEIRIVENDGAEPVMLVMGKTVDDVENAGNVLREFDEWNLEGDEVCVMERADSTVTVCMNACDAQECTPPPTNPITGAQTVDITTDSIEGWIMASDTTFWWADDADKREEIIASSKAADMDMIVVDAKDDGTLGFYAPSFADIAADPSYDSVENSPLYKMIQDAHAEGIKVAARVVLFNDPVYSEAHPEHTITSDQNPVTTWVDPGCGEAAMYQLDIIKELAENYDVDEIHLDFVRYADPDGDVFGNINYPCSIGDDKVEIITDFIDEAVDTIEDVNELQGKDIETAAYVFARTADGPDEWGVGQSIQDIVRTDVSYVSPMLYPTYGGVTSEQAYDYVFEKTQNAIEQAEMGQRGPEKIKPAVDGFGAEYAGNFALVKEQINAVKDAGGTGAFIWWFVSMGTDPDEWEVLAEEPTIPEPEPEEACYDTDYGIDYFTRGTVSGRETEEGPYEDFKDYCKEVDEIREFYCNADDLVEYMDYLCEHGCLDGECKEIVERKLWLNTDHGERWEITGKLKKDMEQYDERKVHVKGLDLSENKYFLIDVLEYSLFELEEVRIELATTKTTYETAEPVELLGLSIIEEEAEEETEEIEIPEAEQIEPDFMLNIRDEDTGEINSVGLEEAKAMDYVVQSPTNRNAYSVRPMIEQESGAQAEKQSRGFIVEFTEMPVLAKKKELEADIDTRKHDLDTSNVLYKYTIGLLEHGAIAYAEAKIDDKLEDQRETVKEQHQEALVAMRAGALAGITGRAVLENNQPEEVILGEFTDSFNGIALDVDKETADLIRQSHLVKKVYKNTLVNATLYDSPPMITADQMWQMNDRRLKSMTGEGVTIGILDTGVDYTHPDLGGCIGQGCKVVDGYDFVNRDDDPMDYHGHGTHCAATAAGNGRLRGVAPNAKIVAYQVLSRWGSGYEDDIIEAIERSADPNQDGDFRDHLNVISMSLGRSCWEFSEECGPDDPMSTAIDNIADSLGVLPVISAGNSRGTIGSPGTARSALTVGAMCKPYQVGDHYYCNQEIASFSGTGPIDLGYEIVEKPDVIAPGVWICAAQHEDAFEEDGAPNCIDTDHVAISGTSMSAPHVAGAAALLSQMYNNQLPPALAKQLLKASASPVTGDLNWEGSGLVDIFEAANIPHPITMEPYTFYVDIDPDGTEMQLVQEFTITNNRESAYTMQLESELSALNVDLSLDKSMVTIDAGATETVTATLTVDSGEVMANTVFYGFIVAMGQDALLKLPVSVFIKDILNVSGDVTEELCLKCTKRSMDLGLLDPSENESSVTRTLYLENLNIQDNESYTVSVENMHAEYGQSIEDGEEIDFNMERTVTLAPGETRQFDIEIITHNAIMDNDHYVGNLVIESAKQRTVIPFRFSKFHVLNVTADSEDMPYDLLVHNKVDMTYYSWFDLTDGETSAVLYLDEAGDYDVILIYWDTDTHYFAVRENVEVRGHVTIFMDREEADNLVSIDARDRDDRRIAHTHESMSGFNFRYKPLDFGSTFFYLGTAIPDSYFISDVGQDYQFSFTMIDYGEGYLINLDTEGVSGDTRLTNSPDELNYHPLVYADTTPRNMGLSHSLGHSSENYGFMWTASGPAYRTPLEKDFNAMNIDEDDVFNLFGFSGSNLDAELGIWDWFDLFRTPFLYFNDERINRKSDFILQYSQYLEPSTRKPIYFNLNPWYWSGKIRLVYYDQPQIYLSAQKGSWMSPIVKQDYSYSESIDMDYSLYKDGLLVGSGPLDSNRIDMPEAIGKYSLILTKEYIIDEKIYLGEVHLSFDTAMADMSPPSIDNLEIIEDNELKDMREDVSGTKIRFKLLPNEGELDTVMFSYVQDGEYMGELELEMEAGYYVAALPEAMGRFDYSFKIFATDTNGNEMVYKFELPADAYPKGESFIQNMGDEDVKGTLSMKAQMKENDVWVDDLEVVNTEMLLPAGEFVDLKQIWDAKGYEAYTEGNYRIVASFDAYGTEATKTKEFIVVGPEGERPPEEEEEDTTEEEPSEPLPAGFSFQITTPGDRLSMYEPLGDVTETIDLDEGIASTSEGAVKFEQYLQLDGSSIDNGGVTFGEDEFDKIGDFLFYNDGGEMFKYIIEFEDGMQSNVESGKLTGIDLADLKFMNMIVYLVDPTISGNSANLKFIAGKAVATMEEGDTELISVDNKDYETTVVLVAGSDGTVKFSINGEVTDELQKGDLYTLADGQTLSIIDVIDSPDTDFVFFALGSTEIVIEDIFEDDAASQGTVKVNGESIEDSEVKITGVLNGNAFELNSIEYTLLADAQAGDFYVPPFQGVREFMDEPQGLLNPGFDIRYEGRGQPGEDFIHSTFIQMSGVETHEYFMEFTNNAGTVYEIPLANSEAGFNIGTADESLWFEECASETDFCIGEDDYLILTTEDGVEGFSHAVQYRSADSEKLTFKDLATGEQWEAAYQGTPGVDAKAALTYSGETFDVYIGAAPDYMLSIDLNNDGQIDAGEVKIIVKGNGIIEFDNPTDQLLVSLRTPADKIEETDIDEVATFTIESVGGVLDVTNTEAIDWFEFNDASGAYGMSEYGTNFKHTYDLNGHSYVSINYPESQVEGLVYFEIK